MRTMTVRNIPDPVADALSRRATDCRMSVNSYVLGFLSEAAMCGGPFPRKRNLSRFCGTMTDGELAAFVAATEPTRRIDHEV